MAFISIDSSPVVVVSAAIRPVQLQQQQQQRFEDIKHISNAITRGIGIRSEGFANKDSVMVVT